LLDLRMPGMPGEENLDSVAGSSGTTGIVIWAEGARETRSTALHDGADDLIDKPFDVDEVEGRIGCVRSRYGGGGEPRVEERRVVFRSPARPEDAGDAGRGDSG